MLRALAAWKMLHVRKVLHCRAAVQPAIRGCCSIDQASNLQDADFSAIDSAYETYMCDGAVMARRTELKGTCNDLLSAFVSRNNDLEGYWALGQCSAWLENEQISVIKVPLIGTTTNIENLKFL